MRDLEGYKADRPEPPKRWGWLRKAGMIVVALYLLDLAFAAAILLAAYLMKTGCS